MWVISGSKKTNDKLLWALDEASAPPRLQRKLHSSLRYMKSIYIIIYSIYCNTCPNLSELCVRPWSSGSCVLYIIIFCTNIKYVISLMLFLTSVLRFWVLYSEISVCQRRWMVFICCILSKTGYFNIQQLHFISVRVSPWTFVISQHSEH